MLSIGEFSKICKVSTKTLRYYAEIGLILPNQINPQNGYRYYSIQQLVPILFINRLKCYQFSLDEIKDILAFDKFQDEYLFEKLTRKQKQMQSKIHAYENCLSRLDEDLARLKEGKSTMSYVDKITVQLVEVPPMQLLSIRKMLLQKDMVNEYNSCFGSLFKKVSQDKLTVQTALCLKTVHQGPYTNLPAVYAKQIA